MADIPDRGTGLLVRDYKGRNANVPVYYVDIALMAELRSILRQAAEELGQRVARSESENLNAHVTIERLNAGRHRTQLLLLQREIGQPDFESIENSDCML